MITNNDYEKSVFVVGLLKELKDRISEKEEITDVKFTPVKTAMSSAFFAEIKVSVLLLKSKAFL